MLGLAAGIESRAQSQPPIDLAHANLEDLMNLTVTSVSKREQPLARTAAAVVVIRAEDIRQSGAISLPDVLRMVPGVDVEQIDANSWAVSIRGFSSRYTNKVLVLIDGRTVYTPSFSGVYWEHLDMPLENIERIEVIRGPGATVWGANAVNGVISIITKSSKNTSGGTLVTGGGSQTNSLAVAQYGGNLGTTGSYRAFGKEFSIGNSALGNGSPAYDHWLRLHAGFRSDWNPGSRDSLMVEGDLFANESNESRWNGFLPSPNGPVFNQHTDATGGNLLARWDHRLAGGSETSLQTYYDSYRRTDLGVPETLRTFNLDFQDHLTPGNRNEIVWGLGYRVSSSALAPGYWVAMIPPSMTDQLFSAFLQDEIRVAGPLWLTVGSKVEHNAYTGFEVEPSLRIAWAPPDSRYTLWAAASRAIRQPARLDTTVRVDLETVPIAPGVIEIVQAYGNPHVKAEDLRDYELGYRQEFSKAVSLDIDAFLSFYHNLETAEPQPLVVVPGSPVHVIAPLQFGNMGRAVDYGGELSVNWNVSRRWRIGPGYAYLHSALRQGPASMAMASGGLTGEFPQNMLTVRSALNVTGKVEFDQSLYYTTRLPDGSVRGHARLDLRLARRLGERSEISVVGQNLLRPRTWEYGTFWCVVGTQAERSVYGQLTWRF